MVVTNGLKLLFLDIDGPIISNRAFFSKPHPVYRRCMDSTALYAINYLCESESVQVVISSTQRVFGDELLARMKHFGFDLTHLHGMLELPITQSRSQEIRNYIGTHSPSKYLALDDEVLDDDISTLTILPDTGMTVFHMTCTFSYFSDDPVNRAIGDKPILGDKLSEVLAWLNQFNLSKEN